MALVVEVEMLMGRYVAKDYFGGHHEPEWPPHPDRLFSALAAAYFECNLGEVEREALEWLETLTPPCIVADPATLGAEPTCRRHVVTTHVPVNDVTLPSRSRKGYSDKQAKQAFALLPTHRSRKARTFPTVVPVRPVLAFVWHGVECPPERFDALQRIAREVTYLGHSSTPVRVTARLTAEPPAPSLVPDQSSGPIVLRGIFRGRLRDLAETYQFAWQASRPERPRPGPFWRYRVYAQTNSPQAGGGTVFSPNLIVFQRTEGSDLPLSAAHELARAVRRALLSRVDHAARTNGRRDIPASICGHTVDGKPAEIPHLAVLPLANVSSRWSDGAIKGFALVLPAGMAPEERRLLLLALGPAGEPAGRPFSTVRIRKGTRWSIARCGAAFAGLRTLDVRPYVGPAACWASVTPVVLDRFPKELHFKWIRPLIEEACRRIALPKPAEIRWGPVSAFRGAGHALAARRAGRISLSPPWIHVLLRFSHAVRGPILLGRGRYLGLGVFRAMSEE